MVIRHLHITSPCCSIIMPGILSATFWQIVHSSKVWKTSTSWVYYHLCLEASSHPIMAPLPSSNTGNLYGESLLLQWWLSAAIWSRVLCSSLLRGSQGLNKSWFPWYFSPTGDFLFQPGTDDLWCAPEGDEQSKLATFCLWLTLMLHHALYYREPERGRPVCGTEDQRTVRFKLGVWVGWDK